MLRLKSVKMYSAMIKKSDRYHIIVNTAELRIYTINDILEFQNEFQLKQWIKNSLFTENQILRIGKRSFYNV